MYHTMNTYPIHLTLYLLFLLIFNYYFIHKYCLRFPGKLKGETDISEYDTISAFSNSWSLSLEIEGLDTYSHVETIKSLYGVHYSNLTLRPTLLFLFLFVLLFTSPFILKRLKYLYKAETRDIQNSQGGENTKILEYKHSKNVEKNPVYFLNLVETLYFRRNQQKNFLEFKRFLVIFFTFMISFLLFIYLVWKYHLDYSIMSLFSFFKGEDISLKTGIHTDLTTSSFFLISLGDVENFSFQDRVYKNDSINFFDWYIYNEELSNDLQINKSSSWWRTETQDITTHLMEDSSQKNGLIKANDLIDRNLFDSLYLFFQIIFVSIFYYLLYTLFARYGVGKALTLMFIVYSFLLYFTSSPLISQLIHPDLLIPSFDFSNIVYDFHFLDSISPHDLQVICKRYLFNFFQKKIDISYPIERYYSLAQMSTHDFRFGNLNLIQMIYNNYSLQYMHSYIPYVECIIDKIITNQIDSHLIFYLGKEMGLYTYNPSNSSIDWNLFLQRMSLFEQEYLELITTQKDFLNDKYLLDKRILSDQILINLPYFFSRLSPLQNTLFALSNRNIDGVFYDLMSSRINFRALNSLLVDIDQILVFSFLFFFLILLIYWFVLTPYRYLFTIPGISKNFFGAFPMEDKKESRITNTLTLKLIQRPFLYHHKNDQRMDFFFYNWIMPSTLYLMPFLWFSTKSKEEYTGSQIIEGNHLGNKSQSLKEITTYNTKHIEEKIGFFDQISKIIEGSSENQWKFANIISEEIGRNLNKGLLGKIKDTHLSGYEYLIDLINTHEFYTKIKSVLLTNQTGFVLICFLNLLFIFYDSIQITHKIVQIRILFALRIKKLKDIASRISDRFLLNTQSNRAYSNAINECKNKMIDNNYDQKTYYSKDTQSIRPKIFIPSQIQNINKYVNTSLINTPSSMSPRSNIPNREKGQMTKSTFTLNNYHYTKFNKNEPYFDISFWGMQDNIIHTSFKEYVSYIRNSYYKLVSIRFTYILISILILKFIYLAYPFFQNTFTDISSDSFFKLIVNIFERYFRDIETYVYNYIHIDISNNGLFYNPFFPYYIQMVLYTKFYDSASLYLLQDMYMDDCHLGIVMNPVISFAEGYYRNSLSKILIESAIDFVDHLFSEKNQTLYNPNRHLIYSDYLKENPFQWISSETKNYKIKIRNQIIFFILNIDLSDEGVRSFKSILDISGLLIVFLIYIRILHAIYKEFQLSILMTQRIPI